jgi:hypothetical protein
MKTTMSALLITAALVLVAAFPTAAYEGNLAYVGVFPDEGMSTCEFPDSGGGLSVAYVVLTNSIPLKQISFRAPIPGCLGGPVNFVFESSPYAVTGDSQTGITIDFGGCITAPATILTIYYFPAPSDPCCPWQVFSHDGLTSQLELVDCNDVTRSGESAVYGPLYTGECCRTFDVLAPYEPYPPDGAAGVSTEVDLSWLLPDQRCGEWLYFSTSPPTPLYPPLDEVPYFTTYDPGTLLPNTTYYWKAYLTCSLESGVSSETWSFTTGDGPVAVETSTWGRVKALYKR